MVMTKREQIEQAIISASAFTGDDTEELLQEVDKVYKKAKAFDEISAYIISKIDDLTIRQEQAPNAKKFEYFGNLLTAFKVIKNKINKLERVDDEY